MNNSKERNSNIEFLRILAIFSIIISHFCVHQSYPKLSFNSMNINYFFTETMQLGSIANHLFIIIAGYFLASKKINYKKIISLILEMLFYSISIGIFIIIINGADITLKSGIKMLFPIFWGNWFLIYYIILYLISPFLNKYIDLAKKIDLRNLIFILIFLMLIIPTFTFNVWNFSNHEIFILDYLIGAYISKYVNISSFSHKNERRKLLISIILYFTTCILLVALSYISKKLIFIKLIPYIIGTNYSFFGVMFAVSIFMFTITKKAAYSNAINYLAGSTLGIYLIHENDYIRELIWKKWLPISKYMSTYTFYLIFIEKVSLVFIICLIIDLIRRKLLSNCEKKLSNKIYIKLKKIYLEFENKFILIR